jgi:hypothetical protein
MQDYTTRFNNLKNYLISSLKNTIPANQREKELIQLLQSNKTQSSSSALMTTDKISC